MRAAKVQASLRICAVSPEPSLLAHISSESRGTFRQKARSLASLNGWACAVKICRDGMLEATNSLDGAHMISDFILHSVVMREEKSQPICLCLEDFTGTMISASCDLLEIDFFRQTVKECSKVSRENEAISCLNHQSFS